ncbi:Ig-like domain-containing protein, partial [Psychrobacter fozii]|uniref:Ig-like domain-containing protein n=1 Tax=Psychrobacter fozii TaxID=198480 RepID=UPI00191A4290
VINATATDAADNVSVESDPASAPDSTAPTAPVIDSFDGTIVVGTAEAGSRVDILDADDVVIGSATADGNGDYSVTLDTPLANGEVINATATDAADNVSVESDPASAPDSTAPTAPVIDSFDGTIVVGTAEANSRVDILDADNTVIGSATADGNGDYSVTLDTPLANGEVINATATDAADNTSVESDPASAPDSTAPTAPVIDSFDGTIVVGTAEAGSRVDILDADDVVIGSATADGNGDYSVTLDTPLTNGEVINATATDAADNVSVESNPASAPDSTAPTAPIIAPVITDNVANDGSGDVLDPAETITDGGVTNDNTPSVIVPADQVTNGTPQLVIDGAVVPSTPVTNGDGSVTLTPTTPLTDGDHDLSYNIIDAANNESDDAPAVSVTVDTTVIIAQDDSNDIDLGKLQVTTYPSVNNANVIVLGVAESDSGAEGTLDFTVSEGANGTVSIEVSQTALVAVADAVNIEVYNSNGDRVYVGTTGGDPLVGDVIGLELLGLTGNDTLTAVVSGLEPGDYTVVMRKSESALTTLVEDVELADLGDSGIILGPDNQEAVLNAVETSLNTDYPILQLGTTVKGILSAALLVTNELGVDALVTLLQDNTVLNTLLGGVVDPVLDAVAVALLSNTLTLLETTDVTATLTEYDFDSSTAITGNVIDPDGLVTGELGEDTVTVNTKLTDISSDSTMSESTSQLVDGVNVFTIQGQYGVLVIDENGDYTYTANGDYASSGETEVFEYTISNGAAGNSDTAKLVINISSTAPAAPIAAATITDNVANDGSGGVLTPSEVIADDGTTNDNTPSLEVAAGVLSDSETLQLVVNGIVVDAVITENTDGSYTLTPQTPLDDAEYELSYNIKDAVSNVSGNAPAVTVTVDTTSPAAVDNESTLNVDVTPTTTTLLTKTQPVGGLLDLGVLSDTIEVSLLSNGNSALIFVVPNNSTEQVTIDGSGSAILSVTGLAALLGLGDIDFDLLVYRVEDGSEDAVLVYEKEDWLVGLGVLNATWNADNLVLPEFEGGGTYYVTLGNSGGLLNANLLSSLSISTVSDVVTNYSPDGGVDGSVAGNVITDLGADGTDTAATGTVVSAVDGLAVTDGTEIIGSYGTLTINSDGSYNYSANATFTGTYGDIDIFEYTITAPNGESSSANLEITIDYDSESGASADRVSASSFTLADDAASIDIPDTSLTVSSEGLDVLSFEGEDQTISLSDIFEVDVIDISGIGANTLTVQAADIANSGTSDAIYVRGDSDDTVDLGNIGADLSDTDGSGNPSNWIDTGTDVTDADGQQYNVWALSTDSATQVNIDVDITNVI